MSTAGILHPGAMGASVAAAMRASGPVLWASGGRSEATAERARAAELEDGETIDALAARCEVIVSVCPPAAAEALAQQVLGAGFRGCFVDANAIAPARARRIEAAVAAAGGRFVDGGIIGPPAWKQGTTRLYLSGAEAEFVAARFAGSPLEAIPIEGGPGAASALKMTYAAYTKGTTALLAAILAVAEAEGVGADLRSEWATSLPEIAQSIDARLGANAAKAWRFAGEMEEIADTFAGAGLPDGFHRAAAEVFARLSEFKDAEGVAGGEVVSTLAATRVGR